MNCKVRPYMYLNGKKISIPNEGRINIVWDEDVLGDSGELEIRLKSMIEKEIDSLKFISDKNCYILEEKINSFMEANKEVYNLRKANPLDLEMIRAISKNEEYTYITRDPNFDLY